jgi:tetratricopeptide (TPR) repeat protein
VHALAQQVLIESATVQALKEIHAAIADALVALYPNRIDEMAERLARHFQEAGQYDQAVQYLLRSAARLEGEGALESAITELRRVIDTLASGDEPQRRQMLDQYERVVALCFRNRTLLDGLELCQRGLQAAESMRSEAHIASLSMWRGRMLVGASRIEEGRRWLDQAQQVALRLDDWRLTREVYLATADADARSGEYEKAIEALREGLRLSHDADDSRAELGCLMPLSLTYARMGDVSAALATLEQAKQRAGAHGEPALMCQLYRLQSQIHFHARDQEASATAAAKAMDIARDAGLQHEAALNAHNMGEAFLRMGDHRRAFAALRNSYETALENGYVRLQMSNIRALGFIDATRFGSAEGRARVLSAIEYAKKHDLVWDRIQGTFLLAIIEQKRGDIEASRAQLRDVLETAAQQGHRKYIEDAEGALQRLDAGESIDLMR